MLKLLMEQSAQIKEMEAKVDKMIKEKEQSSQLAVVPLDVVPITSLLQTCVPIIAMKTGTSSSTMLPTSVTDDSVKLVESMENMYI